MKKPIDFQTLSSDQLRLELKKGGALLDKPCLLAFDCDDTIADRSRGSHFITTDVKKMFSTLRNDKRFKIAINTGRDRLCYRPIERQIGLVDGCIFVAGRVLSTSSSFDLLPHALVSANLRKRILHLLKEEVIPFVEVRTRDGFFFLTKNEQHHRAFMGHDRPPSWFEEMECPIYTDESKFQELLMGNDVVRVDVALFRDQHPKIVTAISKKNLDDVSPQLNELLIDLKGVTVSPVPTSPEQDQLLESLGALCLFSDSQLVNKGKGLEILARNWEIPEGNVLSFGDSASPDASDLAVAHYLPKSHLFIAENGDLKAKEKADFIIGSVQEDGVARAVDLIIKSWS